MALTSIGYDGTITERQWAELIPNVGTSTYGVVDYDDLKVTAVAGQAQTVAVTAGSAWGHGVLDTMATNTTIECDSITSGTRWDLIALRRNWQPMAGGPSSLVVVKGTSSKVIPAGRKTTPGVEDDQPLALVQWKAGQTQPNAILDLRCWAGNGGMLADDLLALTYLNKMGASVNIEGTVWNYALKENNTPAWIKGREKGKVPLFAVGSTLDGGIAPTDGDFYMQAGTSVVKTDQSGYGRITFPKPFPNGLITVVLTNGDSSIDRARNTTLVPALSGPPWNVGTRKDFVYTLMNSEHLMMPNTLSRTNWIAFGW